MLGKATRGRSRGHRKVGRGFWKMGHWAVPTCALPLGLTLPGSRVSTDSQCYQWRPRQQDESVGPGVPGSGMLLSPAGVEF